MSKSLMEKKNDLITRAEEMLSTAKAEERELTEAEMAEIAEIRDNVRKIVKSMGLEEDINELALEEKQEEKEEMKEEERSMEQRDEELFLDIINNRANISPASGSGLALVPTTIANRIMKRVYELSPIVDRATKFVATGKISVPKYVEDSTDKINVAYASEFSDLTANAGNFSSVDLDGFLIGALSKIGKSLINRTNFDVVGFIVEEMAQAIRRFLDQEFLNYQTSSKIAGLKGGVTLSVTASAQNAITTDELVKLQDKIIDAYQENAIWIMHPSTRSALRLLKDNSGHYLLNDDISAPWGKTLLGKPVFCSEFMPEIAHSAIAIYYGDMSGLGAKFAEEMNVEILRELYAPQHAIGVVGWVDVDAKVIDTQKIAKLVMA